MFTASDHNLRNSSFSGNRNIKISGFKDTKQSAELETHKKGVIRLFSMVSQKSRWKRTGIESTNTDVIFFHIHLLNTCGFTGIEAAQFPAVSADHKDSN